MLKNAMTTLLLLASIGCATAPRIEVEAPNALTASSDHVYRAPVHATTDLARGSFVASDADDDAPPVAAPADVETPDVASKAGMVMGSVR